MKRQIPQHKRKQLAAKRPKGGPINPIEETRLRKLLGTLRQRSYNIQKGVKDDNY